MANEHSFTITRSNNNTENLAKEFVLTKDKRFFDPDKKMRRLILEKLGVSSKYSRTYDLVYIENLETNSDEVTIENASEITLIELKATKKKLPKNPSGFFFGATENEFSLAEILGSQYKFCFVCLHEECKSYEMLTLKELNGIIKSKRIQYQINL